MKIIEKKTGDLIPYENNPRINDRAVDAVAASIREFGFKQPIVIDKDGVIVCGHTRHKAAQKIGLKTVPCVLADDLTEEQIRAYRIVDNKTNELAVWDMEKLDLEMKSLESFDMGLFRPSNAVGSANTGEDWFAREDRNDTNRQEGNDEYNEFLDKFEQPKTTDDCYTPDNIYEAVASWTAKEYGLDRKRFVRPFFPGGDFENYPYRPGDVVVDNPPFSILSQIYDFYLEKKIDFLLFAPCMTSLKTSATRGLCSIYDDCDILYENGATVPTAFVTSLEKEYITRTAPELGAAVREANNENLEKQRKSLPKYKYPDNVISSAAMSYIGRYSIDLRIKKAEAKVIDGLDSQKAMDKVIYGGGLLVSDRAAAEKAAAEKAAAEKAAAEKAAAIVWELSEREKEIVRKLGGE